MSQIIPKTAHVSLAEALSQGPPPLDELAIPVFTHGSLEVELYAPQEVVQVRQETMR